MNIEKKVKLPRDEVITAIKEYIAKKGINLDESPSVSIVFENSTRDTIVSFTEVSIKWVDQHP